MPQGAALKFDYLDPATGEVSATPTEPTQRLQIVATLGQNMPDPPRTLREFGLVGQLGGKTALINAVRHVAIVKDSASTLVRTIQLVF